MNTDDDLQKLDLATDMFARALGEIGPQPSRCIGWSTWDVANHVLGGAVRYTRYFTGGDASELAWTRTADHLGDDPVDAHRRLSAELRQEFVDHRDDGIVLHHLVADVDAPTLLVMRVQELVLHSWDITSMADPTIELDPSLCRFLLARGELVRSMLRSASALGSAKDATGGGLTEQVLAEWGRRPSP